MDKLSLFFVVLESELFMMYGVLSRVQASDIACNKIKLNIYHMLYSLESNNVGNSIER